MKVIVWLTVVLGGIFLAMGHAHYEKYGHINFQAQTIILFLLINILICFWELALCYRYDYINKTHAKRLKSGYYTAKMAAKRDPIIIFQDMSIMDWFNPTFWAHIWIDYAKWDDSYADKTTFGYCIDVGNGHTTLIPSILLAWSIVEPLFSAKVTGMIGLLTFYQTWYGTVLYFYQYINNGRYKMTPLAEVLGIVCVSNGIWFFFPMLGFYGSVRLIMNENFDVWQ